MRYLEKVKIPEQALKYPGQLSGGQQQRVAIARSLCMNPKHHAVRRADLGARPGDDQGGARPPGQQAGATSRAGGDFLSGLLITLANPKVILFYLGLLPTFIDLQRLTAVDILVTVAVVSAVLGATLLGYALAAARAREPIRSRRAAATSTGPPVRPCWPPVRRWPSRPEPRRRAATRWSSACRTRMHRTYCPPPNEPLHVHYRDEHLLVVEKVSGLLTVPGRGADKQDCLLHRVQRDVPEALVVHRLDMDTSGLVLFARDSATQGSLGRLFQRRRVDKRYAALVKGRPESDEGDVALPLILDWPNRPRQKVDPDTGKPAHTRYRVVAPCSAGSCSRVELFPTTGRSHQLRVHMAALGHPVLGDDLYADAEAYAMAERLMLHAEALAFDHPAGKGRLELFSPAPF